MDFYEAVLHSFSTISTGGFSTRNASIAAFGSPAITWIVAIFMFLSGINFSLIFISLRGHIREALHSEELRLYTLLTLGPSAYRRQSHGAAERSAGSGAEGFRLQRRVHRDHHRLRHGGLCPVAGLWSDAAGDPHVHRRLRRVYLRWHQGLPHPAAGKAAAPGDQKILHPKHISVITVDGQLVEDRVVSSAAATWWHI